MQLPQDPQLLHHAYVIEGDGSYSRRRLFDFLQKQFGVSHGHPDVYVFSVEDFGVDHSADIISANLRRPIAGERTFIIADFSSISHQAQNSLLKVLEEPRGKTHIFLITNSSAVFLPTVLSRVHIVSFDGGDLHEGNLTFDPSKEAQLFLKNDSAKRLDQVKKILDLKSDEEINDADIERFTAELEKRAHAYAAESGDAASVRRISEPLMKADDYMRDPSSSTKLLLEYAALMLPVIK